MKFPTASSLLHVQKGLIKIKSTVSLHMQFAQLSSRDAVILVCSNVEKYTFIIK